MAKTLSDFIPEISARCAEVSPRNEVICAVSETGELLMDEMPGSGNSFTGDVIEQCQFRGGTPRVAIEQRLLMRDAWAGGKR